MTAFRSIGAPLEDDGSGTEPIETRKGLAGIFTGPGVLPGAASPLVTGTSGWAYQVGRCNLVSSRGASDGVHLWGNDGPVSITTADDGSTLSAPGSGVSRIDIIYGLHPSNGENADDTSQPYFAVRKGSPDSSPQPPTLPAGALELARNTMAAAATSTGSSGNSISQTAAPSAPVPIRPLVTEWTTSAANAIAPAANVWANWLTLTTLDVPAWATLALVHVEVNGVLYTTSDIGTLLARLTAGSVDGPQVRAPNNAAGAWASWGMRAVLSVTPGATGVPLYLGVRRSLSGGSIRADAWPGTSVSVQVEFLK